MRAAAGRRRGSKAAAVGNVHSVAISAGRLTYVGGGRELDLIDH